MTQSCAEALGSESGGRGSSERSFQSRFLENKVSVSAVRVPKSSNKSTQTNQMNIPLVCYYYSDLMV